MKYIKMFEKFKSDKDSEDSWLNTSWEDEEIGKVTISDVIKYLDDNDIVIKRVDISDIKPIIIDQYYTKGDHKKRVEESTLKYPIIVVVKNGKYKSILDGNHRAYKAMKNKNKTIKVRELDLDSETTPKIFNKLFNYKIKPLKK